MTLKKLPLIASLAATLFATGLIAHQAYSDPAVVINPAGFCVVINGDGILVAGDNLRIVNTQSANGNSLKTCYATGVANSQGHAVTYDTDNNPILVGLQCFNPTTGQFTTDWHETVSASGNAKLQCHFKS